MLYVPIPVLDGETLTGVDVTQLDDLTDLNVSADAVNSATVTDEAGNQAVANKSARFRVTPTQDTTGERKVAIEYTTSASNGDTIEAIVTVVKRIK